MKTTQIQPAATLNPTETKEKASKSSFGSRLCSLIGAILIPASFTSCSSSAFDEILDIPMTLIDMPMDILGDPDFAEALSSPQTQHQLGEIAASFSPSPTTYRSSSFDDSPENKPQKSAAPSGRNIGAEMDEYVTDLRERGRKGNKELRARRQREFNDILISLGRTPLGAPGSNNNTVRENPERTKFDRLANAGGPKQWTKVGDFNGVSVSWRYRKELKDQYISELRFTNATNRDIECVFSSHFVDGNGKSNIESPQKKTLRAGKTVAGQWSGLFYYPGDNTIPPIRGGVTKMTLTPK